MDIIKPFSRNSKLFALLIVISLLCLSSNIGISIKTSDSEDSQTYDFLIITPEEFSKEIKPLEEHKEKYGIKTKIVTLKEVYEEMFWQGRDDAEKIKYFIKKAYDEWNIKYVLLVGGIKNQLSKEEQWWLPVRYSYLEERWTAMPRYKENKFLSDLYFADIYDNESNFCSWDTDNDGYYGEWFGNNSAEDILDLYPEVYLGRLPCRNRFEVRVVVHKIINYETKKADESWFKKMVVVAGDSYVGEDDIDGDNKPEGEIETQKALDQMPGFEPIKLWTSTGSWRYPVDIIFEINKGCGFCFFNSHGCPSGFSDHPPNSTEWIFGLSNYNLFLLRNRNKLPVCVNLGCHCSMFNVSLGHSTKNSGRPCYECINWRLVTKINGGCIATIGFTGLALITEDKLDPSQGGASGGLVTRFFKEYGINNNTILGDCYGKAIQNYIESYPIDWDQNSYNDSAIDAKVVEQLVLFGDPTLKIGGYDKSFLNQ